MYRYGGLIATERSLPGNHRDMKRLLDNYEVGITIKHYIFSIYLFEINGVTD